ncbi:MAG: phosphatase PAP2 family protein, partial [Povalibacter sp.]
PAIARALFYDPSAHSWIGAGVIWVEALIHSGGRLLIGVLLSASLCIWMVARLNPQISELRRPATYFSLSVILSIGCIALLKLLTNVHCPWSLEVFGGHYPYIELFSPRPQALKTGQCFPAAHASCGYALLALFFVFRERSRRLARTGIVVAILAGLLFGISQQSRGAHFLSHDVWSAFIVWAIAASLYVFAFRARLWRDNI